MVTPPRRRQSQGVDLERGRADESGVADDHLYILQAAHPRFDTLARLRDDAVLARFHACHVDAERSDVEAVLRATLRLADGPCAGHQGLRGHATDVDARASEVVAFDHRRPQPLLAAACSDRRPGLACTNDDSVELFGRHVLGLHC